MNQLKHLAIIMDGNRRYARSHNMLPYKGHEKGLEAVKTTISVCLEKKIPYLTLYVFSLENFNRSKDEIRFLFSLLIEQIIIQKNYLIEHGIRIRFIGDRSKFPKKVLEECTELEDITRNGKSLNIQALFCYGGQQEIIFAATRLYEDLSSGKLHTDAIENSFRNYLWMPAMPDPDLIIRTGAQGARRLSNFLLYQAAYAELYFTDVYWPSLTREELQKALDYFYTSKRNFGF